MKRITLILLLCLSANFVNAGNLLDDEKYTTSHAFYQSYKQQAVQKRNVFQLGLRLDTGVDVGLDAVLNLNKGRLHMDLGLSNGYFDLLYDWVFPIDKGKLNFYLGAGAGVGFNGAAFYGALEAGLEYNFSAPITLGFDWRPRIGFTNDTGFVADEVGLNIRYRF